MSKSLSIAVVVATFLAALVVFSGLRGETAATGGGGAGADTHLLRVHEQIEKVRVSEDPRHYAGAERELAAARRLDRGSASCALAAGALAMSKHDFPAGLRWGERAHRLAPTLVRPLGLIGDAQMEMGRYEDAERTLQRLVDLKPGLPAYARISYFRELHGDLPGALEAMRLAVAAGGSRPDDVADTEVQLGQLELAAGNVAAGERLFRKVLHSQPSHARALDGLADVELARRDVEGALARWRKLSAAVPSPHYATDVVELAAATGRPAESRRAVERVRSLDAALAAAGVNVDTESAVFEADYGSPRRALAMARRAYGRAPSIGRADALGWALTRNGRAAEGLRHARESMRLGSPDPMFVYHAAIAARDAGRTELARRWLTRLLAEQPGFSPLHEPRAKRILRSLG